MQVKKAFVPITSRDPGNETLETIVSEKAPVPIFLRCEIPLKVICLSLEHL